MSSRAVSISARLGLGLTAFLVLGTGVEATADGLGYVGIDTGAGPCMTAIERQAIDKSIASHQLSLERGALGMHRSLAGRALATEPRPYPFYPQAGNLWGDLWANNFVDLDPTTGILDWDCSGFTYDGHRGHDTDIRSFGEQAVGVPIFAALNGTVLLTIDGEPDTNTSCEPLAIANQVRLYHGDAHYSLYLHMKNGSIAVAGDDVVTAGTELGLTASSGCSTAPHLHFESLYGGTTGLYAYEPSAGPCRAGTSYWVSQTPIERSLYMSDFTVTSEDLSAWAGLPADTSRTGSFVSGVRDTYFWYMLRNVPASSTYRVRYQRPDSSFAIDDTGALTGGFFQRWISAWHHYSVNFDQVGAWRIIYDVNGSTMVDAPVTVVASAGEVQNRAPNAISVSLDPAAPDERDVVFCRVSTSLTLDDPDYDIVRYRYEWRVGATTVRDVTHAGQADALAWDQTRSGEALECHVTASDGMDEAATVMTRATVQSACPAVPEAGCRQALSSAVAIALKGADKNKLKWKWSKGDATSVEEFADPSYGTDYTLCVYDGVAGSPVLAAGLALPSHIGWSETGTKGYKYKDKTARFSGATNVKLKAGAHGKAKALLKAKGSELPISVGAQTIFEQDPEVIVQLLSSDGVCWTSTFATAKKNTSTDFKAKSP